MKKTALLLAASLSLVSLAASAQRVVLSEFPLSATGRNYAVIMDAAWVDGVVEYDYDIEAECNVEHAGAGIHLDMGTLNRFRKAVGKLSAEFLRCSLEADAAGTPEFIRQISVRLPFAFVDLQVGDEWLRSTSTRLRAWFERKDGKDLLYLGTPEISTVLASQLGVFEVEGLISYWIFTSAEELIGFEAALDKRLADEAASRIRQAETETRHIEREMKRVKLN